MEAAKRACRKCLIRDFDKAGYFQNMYEYIENLEEDVKTEASLYEERLQACKQCDRLLEGMCVACGCFVEMRAAVKKNSCPYKIWERKQVLL